MSDDRHPTNGPALTFDVSGSFCAFCGWACPAIARSHSRFDGNRMPHRVAAGRDPSRHSKTFSFNQMTAIGAHRTAARSGFHPAALAISRQMLENE
jgi:hypothetical protein